jgi:hypothetical protein
MHPTGSMTDLLKVAFGSFATFGEPKRMSDPRMPTSEARTVMSAEGHFRTQASHKPGPVLTWPPNPAALFVTKIKRTLRPMAWRVKAWRVKVSELNEQQINERICHVSYS